MPEASITRGRQTARRFMTDFGTMFSPTGRAVQDPDTGEEVPEFQAEYTSICKIQANLLQGNDSSVHNETIGGVERTVLDAGLHLPYSDKPVQVGWEFRVDRIGTQSDPGLLGKRYRIIASPIKSFATARRLDVYEV